MTQPPPYPSASGMSDPYASSGVGGWPAPTWVPTWDAHPPAPPFATAPPRASSAGRGPLVLALVAAAGALVGAVVAGLLVAVLFSAAAEDIGRGMGEEFSGSVDGMFGVPDEGMWSSEYVSPGPVEEHPATAPGQLGPDPVLDAYAQGCFDGDMQACDDLYYESPPMSAYEEYAGTCGGRVKQFAVMACTDLD
ncbi:hypothetical protein [Blastococcus sp. CT_GayMR16]|uniref:hypothetical protein n=1 Tax=Blastococcus sp. CT_GayMR16 TaxID=2559607 RepID=UPI0010734531|nr:hypothetical protein [Blastococcus sp. CT_GayMR16]TFV83294.1 hypothetical protein E4P38_20535 [Blastococcus sp. CT_GayMR16]